MIKAVLFDVDGVLLDSFESNLLFYQKLFLAFSYPPPTREQYRQLFHQPLKGVIQSLVPDISTKDLELMCDPNTVNKYRPDSSMSSLMAGSQLVVERLHEHYLLGLVTSRIRIGIYENSHLQPLIKYMKTIVTLEDTDEHKPSPQPLLLATSNLKLKPHHCVYIGDAETDLIAAQAAGMRFIMFSSTPNTLADATVTNLRDIPKTIEKLS